MAAIKDKAVLGYLIPNGCSKFYCYSCAEMMSPAQRDRAIEVHFPTEAPIGTVCYYCGAYLEEYGELDEDDPFWDDEYNDDASYGVYDDEDDDDF